MVKHKKMCSCIFQSQKIIMKRIAYMNLGIAIFMAIKIKLVICNVECNVYSIPQKYGKNIIHNSFVSILFYKKV